MRCLQDSLSLCLVFQARVPSNMTSSSLTPSSHRFLGFSYPSFHWGFSWCLLLSVFQAKVTVCSLGIGAMFGESVLDDLPREGTVVTRSTVELLRIERRDFRHIWEVSAFRSIAFDLQEVYSAYALVHFVFVVVISGSTAVPSRRLSQCTSPRLCICYVVWQAFVFRVDVTPRSPCSCFTP
jgi:hypothetical protein